MIWGGLRVIFIEVVHIILHITDVCISFNSTASQILLIMEFLLVLSNADVFAIWSTVGCLVECAVRLL
jgi:hypothetical protein